MWTCARVHIPKSLPKKLQANQLNTQYDLDLTHIFGQKSPYRGLLCTDRSPAPTPTSRGERISEPQCMNSLGGALRSFWALKTQPEFQRFLLRTTDDARTSNVPINNAFSLHKLIEFSDPNVRLTSLSTTCTNYGKIMDLARGLYLNMAFSFKRLHKLT